MALISTSIGNCIGTIMFNHSQKRNCLSSLLIGEMMAALDQFDDAKAHVVVLRAEPGSHVWSAGHDIDELPLEGQDPLAYSIPLEGLLRRVQQFPAPVIAMIEGSVWGGACDLAMACSILIGTDNSSFAMTPAKIGIPYNPSGLIHFINVMGIHKVQEMFFTGQPVPPEDALRVGILNHLVPRESLEAFTYDMAEKIAQNSPMAIRVIKEQLRLLSKGHPLDAETYERIQALRQTVYQGEDYREGICSFKERRHPLFTGR